jgi:uncharacterized protein
MGWSVICSLIFIVSIAGIGSARADDFRVPALTGPVVDDANILSPEMRSVLENGIRRLRDGGGTQITVLTVPSLGGLEIEQASIKVADAWKLGGAKTDNGVLLLVAPTEHKVRIEVGQGLEGSLTDAFSNRIIRDTITPYFRKGDYSSGVLQGVAAIIHYTDPSVDPASLFNGARASSDRDSSDGQFPWILVIFGVVFLFSLFRGGGGRGGRMSPWGAGAIGYALGRLGGGGGSGGWGGGGGGGWSGGGGGSSGGGASGGW